MTIYDKSEFDSPQEAIEHYRELLRALRARKRALEVQKAEYGIDAPAYVRTELEKVSTAIQQLAAHVKELDAIINPLTPVPSAQKPNPSPLAKVQLFVTERGKRIRPKIKGAWRYLPKEQKQLAVLLEIIYFIDNQHQAPSAMDLHETMDMISFEVQEFCESLLKVDFIRLTDLGLYIPTGKGRAFAHSNEP
jgi:hypothetical protein